MPLLHPPPIPPTLQDVPDSVSRAIEAIGGLDQHESISSASEANRGLGVQEKCVLQVRI